MAENLHLQTGLSADAADLAEGQEGASESDKQRSASAESFDFDECSVLKHLEKCLAFLVRS